MKDVLKRENIEVKHCKTENMIADFFTKPLQGSLFKKLRNYIMGSTSLPIEERVELRENQNEKRDTIDKKVKETKEKRSYSDIVKGNYVKNVLSSTGKKTK